MKFARAFTVLAFLHCTTRYGVTDGDGQLVKTIRQLSGARGLGSVPVGVRAGVGEMTDSFDGWFGGVFGLTVRRDLARK